MRPPREPAGLAAARPDAPFRRAASLAAEAPSFCRAPEGGATGRRTLSVLRLTDGFGIFSAPADLLGTGVKDLSDFLDQILGQARLGHEPVTTCLLCAFGNVGDGLDG